MDTEVVDMRTCNGLLVVVALVAVMVSAGNAAAFGEPIFGYVSTTAAEGDVVVLWVENDRINNPNNNKTVPIGHLASPNSYYFQDIEPLLKGHGKNIYDPFTVTVALLCSGVDMGGNPYTNTYHNDAGVTQADTYGIAGPTFMPDMDMEPCAAGNIFSKPLSAGWNLISLPLTPLDNSTIAVLSGASCDAAYQYNAELEQFESVLDATMDPGIGYFVHVTADCTWEYNGTTAYTTMDDVPLEEGLNMVGWLNCSMDVDGALSSVSGDYFYVAQWNTSAQKFDVYNPAAPSAFNDCLTTMDRGTGYFISMKHDRTLSESC